MTVNDRSVHAAPLSHWLEHLMAAAIAAVAPENCVARHMHWLGPTHLQVGPAACNVDNDQPILLLAIGKAALAMAIAALEIVGDKRPSGGLVIGKNPGVDRLGPLQVLAGDHPVPGTLSLQAGHAIQCWARGQAAATMACTPMSQVVVLLSGGASALVCSPRVEFGLWQAMHEWLLRTPVTIAQINAIRGPLDRLKHGGLAAILPATSATLVLSDVIGDRLDVVASAPMGPVVPFVAKDAAQQLAALVPQGTPWLEPCRQALLALPDRLQPLAAPNVGLCGSNADARQAALAAARCEGLAVIDLGLVLRGEARLLGETLVRALIEKWATIAAGTTIAIVGGGETIVRVEGTGVGSRNQELGLAMARELALAQREGAMLPKELILACVASDGDDGPTGSAGVWIDLTTWERAHTHFDDVETRWRNNDCDPIFRALGQRLSPWQSQTNVGDLLLGVARMG